MKKKSSVVLHMDIFFGVNGTIEVFLKKSCVKKIFIFFEIMSLKKTPIMFAWLTIARPPYGIFHMLWH